MQCRQTRLALVLNVTIDMRFLDDAVDEARIKLN